MRACSASLQESYLAFVPSSQVHNISWLCNMYCHYSTYDYYYMIVLTSFFRLELARLEFAQSIRPWSQLSSAEALRHVWLRFNPLWWLSIAGCAACILLGHGFHKACCQGGPVRDDEMEVERRARIWYVYCGPESEKEMEKGSFEGFEA